MVLAWAGPGHAMTRPGPAQARPSPSPGPAQDPPNIGKLENLNKNWKILENIEKIGKLKVFQYFWSKILEKHNVFDGFECGWPDHAQTQPRQPNLAFRVMGVALWSWIVHCTTKSKGCRCTTKSNGGQCTTKSSGSQCTQLNLGLFKTTFVQSTVGLMRGGWPYMFL